MKKYSNTLGKTSRSHRAWVSSNAQRPDEPVEEQDSADPERRHAHPVAQRRQVGHRQVEDVHRLVVGLVAGRVRCPKDSASSRSPSWMAMFSAFIGGRSRRMVPTPSETSRFTVMRGRLTGANGERTRCCCSQHRVRFTKRSASRRGRQGLLRPLGPGHVPAVQAVLRSDLLVPGVLGRSRHRR